MKQLTCLFASFFLILASLSVKTVYSAGVSPTATSYDMKVLVLKYFPLTASNNIDLAVTGDVGDPYPIIKQRTVDITNNLVADLPRATTYLGYSNPNAIPSLRYQIVNTKEYTQAVPFDPTTRRPLYFQILQSENMCNYVENQGVNEVWIWAYQGPTIPGGQYPYLNISESKMAGPFGDISNSYRLNDMPICSKTYRVYTFNYGRGTSEAVESWSHQIEAELDAVDVNYIFRSRFQGSTPYPQVSNTTGRCGSDHNPPNARFEYDRANSIPQRSDCLNWNPDSLGATTNVGCANWSPTCSFIGDNDNPSLNYQIWNWQNLPGRLNTKTLNGKQLRNWWDVHGDFDNVMRNSRTLLLPTVPYDINGDGKVNILDLARIVNARTQTEINPYSGPEDVSKDGKLNAADLTDFLTNLTHL